MERQDKKKKKFVQVAYATMLICLNSLFVNCAIPSLMFLNWMPSVLNMPELELTKHTGLDSIALMWILSTWVSSYIGTF